MNAELLVLEDGRLCIAVDTPFDPPVGKVEYDRTSRLVVIFPEGDPNGILMEYELSEDAASPLESASICRIALIQNKSVQDHYDVPLVQIGI